jgi:Flp pilus assembly protein CpaB
VAVAAVLVFSASLAGGSKSGQDWVVTARPLPAGTVLGPDDIAAARLRLSGATKALAYRQPTSVEGRALVVAVPAGALLESPLLAPAGQQRPVRPVSVAADPVSLAGLTPGQPVDVLATQGSGASTAVTVVVRGATLLEAASGGTGSLSPGATGQVTIGVTSLPEVEAVVQAAHAGTVILVAAEPADGSGAGPGAS